jgi:hypothetical protein
MLKRPGSGCFAISAALLLFVFVADLSIVVTPDEAGRKAADLKVVNSFFLFSGVFFMIGIRRYMQTTHSGVQELMSNGHYRQADGICKLMVSIHPKDSEYWVLWGVSSEAQGLKQSALLKYQKALECDPSNAFAKAQVETLGKPRNS